MSNSNTHSGSGSDTSAKKSSSQGNSPVAVTPKDVTPEDATWQDRTERNLQSDDEEKHTEALVDESSELSFPASDPPAVSTPTRLERDKDGNLHPADESKKH